MMTNFEIPSALTEKWEREAIAQGVSKYEIGNFMKMKAQHFQERQSTKIARPEIYANAARNKFTDYGNEVALQKHLELPEDRRAILNARCKMESLEKKLSQIKSAEQRDIFLAERESWFAYLKEKMKDLRISKERLLECGLNWKNAVAFAYRTL